MQGQPNRVVIFDIYNTLFSLDKPKHLIRDLFSAPPDTYLFWWSNTMCTAQSLALQNEFIPFRTVLEKELTVTIRNSGAPSFKPNSPEVQSYVKLIIDSFKELDLKKGAIEALEMFKKNNFRLVCLANGSEEWAHTVLKRAGIENYFQDVICCDTLKTYKPSPIVFERLCKIPGDEKWIISSVNYDFIGAKKYGFKTVFCSDLEGVPDVIPPPDLKLVNLRNVAEVMTHKC